MNNLIAYMPVINRQYLLWLKDHEPFHLHLISQDLAEALIPRLKRNICALPAVDVYTIISGLKRNPSIKNSVKIFFLEDSISIEEDCLMPDEDISHVFAEKYLKNCDCEVKFEPIWARWDMTAVKRQEPIMPDMEITYEEIDTLRMIAAFNLGKKSPDWWRQIGALAFRDGKMIACAYNKHYPNEYETAIFSDPRINFDAGDIAGSEIYLSLHAEKGIIATCAREGISLKGATVYVTDFPCADCARMLAKCQIKRLIFNQGYSVLKGFETLKAAEVKILKVKK
ncbi:MAG: hypothetical protein JW740_00370 [Candidatus Zambryskibacteria bacterium]|nr:hypothetical protein [Candidatus Zambryskibacteria bacterium]